MTYAIVKTGGKQYRVSEGDVVKIEKLQGAAGDKVSLTDVLAIGGGSAKIGAPFIVGASVSGEIIAQTRDEKVIVFKKKRRHNYRRRNGHRQYITLVRITGIVAGK